MNEPKQFAEDGQTMTCCVCGKVERYSSLAAQTQWRVIEVDRVRHYACPAEFPPDGASSGQYELAYKRVLKTIIEKQSLDTTRTDTVQVGVARLETQRPLPPPRPMNERDVRHLQKVDFGLRLSGPEGFSLLAALQLALRHPNYPAGPSREIVESVAQLLQEQVSVTENLTAVAAAGWGVEQGKSEILKAES